MLGSDRNVAINIKVLDTLFSTTSVFLNVLAVRLIYLFGVDVQHSCFLFCEINAYNRTLNYGNGYSCLFLYIIWFISMIAKLWVLKSNLINRINVTRQRLLRYGGVCFLDLLGIVILHLGISFTCEFALKYSGIGRCNRVAFDKLDFYAFKPKYTNGFSFPIYHTDARRLVCYSLLCWLIAFVANELKTSLSKPFVLLQHNYISVRNDN